MGVKDRWSDRDKVLVRELIEEGITDPEVFLKTFNERADQTRNYGGLVVRVRSLPSAVAPDVIKELKRGLGRRCREQMLTHEEGSEYVYYSEAMRLCPGRNNAWLHDRIEEGLIRTKGGKRGKLYHRADLLNVHRNSATAPRASHSRETLPMLPDNYLKQTAPSKPTRPEDLKLKIVMADGAWAEQANAKNYGNRNRSDPRVEYYEREMIAGRWALNGETIVFGADGRLYNGQHRIEALIRAAAEDPSIQVPFIVVEGVSEDVLPTIDKVKARRVYDDFHIAGRPQARRITAIINGMVRIVQNRTEASTVQAEAIYEFYKEGIDWAVDAVTGANHHAIIAGALAYAYRRDPAAVEAFNTKLQTRVGMTEGEPAHVLDNYLSGRGQFKQDSTRVRGLKVLRMIQAHIKGERIASVNVRVDTLRYFAAAYGLAPNGKHGRYPVIEDSAQEVQPSAA